MSEYHPKPAWFFARVHVSGTYVDLFLPESRHNLSIISTIFGHSAEVYPHEEGSVGLVEWYPVPP